MQNEENLGKSWLVVMSAGAFFFYSFIQMTLFSTIEMKEYFSGVLGIGDPGTFGMFAGMFLYGCVIFLIPAGLLLDKVSVKKLLIVSLSISILSVFGLTFVSNLQAAMVLRFITGIMHCIAFMAPLRLAPRWFPSRRLALAVGLLITFAVSGGLVSQTPMYWSLQAFGGQMTMLFNSLLGVVILILVVLFVKDHPETAAAEKEGVGGEVIPLGASFKMVIKNKQNWLAGLYVGLLNLSVLLLGAIWGTNYLKIRSPELSSEIITSVIGMIFIGTMVGSPLCGWLSDRVQNRKWSMFAGAFLSLLIMLAIMYLPNPGSGLLGIITAAQTIGYPVIAESNDERIIGAANGFGAVLIMGMAAIAQPLFGSLINMFGGETAASYTKAIYLMPVSFLIALICTLLLDETFKKSKS
jgi:MFS family permease